MLLLSAGGADGARRKRRSATKAGKPPEDVIEEIKKADLDFCEATKAKRLDGWMSYFADDAVAFPAGKPLISGKEELRTFYARMFEDPSLEIHWKPVRADAAASGDLGYTIGTAEFRTKDKDGKILIRPGKYLTVWKRQADGTWKVAADLGN